MTCLEVRTESKKRRDARLVSRQPGGVRRESDVRQ
jgi:hypothetical protein